MSMSNILFNEDISKRYLTLESNIKSKSNSFYDSYLDLLETTIKYFLDENSVWYDNSKTCGHIIKDEQTRIFLLNAIKLDEHTFDKLIDYIKKCNDHKHKKEKTLKIDGVINFLEVYFNLINSYLVFKNAEAIAFSPSYYISIFNEVGKINNQLTEQYELLAKRTIDIENKVDTILNSLNETPKDSKKEKIKDQPNPPIYNLLRNADKFYFWEGAKKSFFVKKLIICILYICVFTIGVVSTILTTKKANLYTTFTFFENLWLFFSVFYIIHFLSLKHKMSHEKFAEHLNEKFQLDQFNCWKRTFEEKKRYKVFRIISHVCCFLNAFYLIFCIKGSISIAPIIFEILFFILSLLLAIFVTNFNDNYSSNVLFDLKNQQNTKLLLLFNQKFISIEEARENHLLDFYE